MDKVKRVRINGVKEQRIGIPLGIYDKNGVEICSGDKVYIDSQEFIILYNIVNKRYTACDIGSMWYGEDVYNANSYGKSYDFKLDNGIRMRLEKKSA